MTDPLQSLNDQDMSRPPQSAPTSPAATPPAEATRKTVSARGICPFCGQQRPAGTAPCPQCTMENTPATRQATKTRIGPWFVLQTRNPSAPGMNYETVLTLVTRGQITARSVMRGPTSAQLWRLAGNVRGISREFGMCYNCGRHIDKQASMCSACNRSQEPPPDPDVLLESREQAAVDQSSHAARLTAWQRQRSTAGSRTPLLPPPTANGTRDQNAGNWARDGSVVSAVGLAAALADQHVGDEKPRRRGHPFLLALLLLLAAGAALLWARPDYREKSKTWTTDHWALLKQQVDSIQWNRNPAVPETEINGNPLRHPPAAEKPAAPLVQIKPPTPDVPAAPDRPADAVVEPKAPAIEISPPEPAAPKPMPSVTINAAPADALAESREWWSSALDAESKKDYTAAVQYYEKITRLPNEYWQAGLRRNLEAARHQLNESAIAK